MKIPTKPVRTAAEDILPDKGNAVDVLHVNLGNLTMDMDGSVQTLTEISQHKQLVFYVGDNPNIFRVVNQSVNRS